MISKYVRLEESHPVIRELELNVHEELSQKFKFKRTAFSMTFFLIFIHLFIFLLSHYIFTCAALSCQAIYITICDQKKNLINVQVLKKRKKS